MEENKNKRFEIIINSGLEKETNDILSRYWKFDGTEFLERIGQIGNEYGKTYAELLQIIKTSSTAYIADNCVRCGKELLKKIKSQTKFLEYFHGKNHCIDCQEVIDKNFAEQRKQAYRHNEIERSISLIKAVEDRAWQQLSLEENRLLLRIIESPSGNIDFGNFENLHYHEKLKLVEKFVALNLIDRGSAFEVDDHRFGFSPDLQANLKRYIEESAISSNEPLAAKWSRISFELKKNHQFRNSDTPLHSGTITFEQDVIIKAGAKCLYSVWPRESGNAWLSITPVSDIIVSDNKSIDNEPEPLKSILKRVLNHH